MPELPEVNVIASDITDVILGKYLRGIILHEKSRYCKNGILNMDGRNYTEEYFKNGIDHIYLINAKVKEVFTVGKKIFIKIKLVNGSNKGKILYISSFLSLYGTWRFDKSDGAKHSLVFTDKLDDGEETNLYYHDKRNWGIFNITEDYKSVLKEYFKNKIKLPKLKDKTIGWFLMEQKYMSGIGVYIRCDSLYKSKISPYRLLSSLSENDIKCIYNNVKKIMLKSFDAGGYSFYLSPFGIKGTYKSLITNKKIDDCGNKIEKTKLGDRNLYWVPDVQI